MRDILVHLDGEARSAEVCAAAVSLAQRFGARLTGLFGRLDGPTAARLVARPSDHHEAAAERCHEMFATAVAEAGVEGRWWAVPHGAGERVLAAARLCAHYADLVVVGQEDDASRTPAGLGEQVIHHGGRPVLVVPRVGHYPVIGERVVVGWNAARESTRALHDSLPLLQRAHAVTLLTVHDGASPRLNGDDTPPVDMVDHLARWGVAATHAHPVRDQVRTADLLLSQSCDLGADLLVLGAAARFAGPAGGSVTRFVSKHMPLPVLFSC